MVTHIKQVNELKFCGQRVMLVMLAMRTVDRESGVDRHKTVCMNPSMKFSTISFLWLLLEISACRESSLPPQAEPMAGDHTMLISASGFDAFGQALPIQGPVSVTLTSSDRTWRMTIPEGASSCSFTSLPSQVYVIHAEREGFYPYETTGGDQPYGTWSPHVWFYQIPPPTMRIDSIRCFQDLSNNSLKIRMFTGQNFSSRYYTAVIVFSGKDQNVSPKPGTYDHEFTAAQSGGNEIDFNQAPTLYGAAKGTRVYVTARFTTGATRAFWNAATSTYVWTNLEENTTAVASFVLQ
jgi:hypothetical protein